MNRNELPSTKNSLVYQPTGNQSVVNYEEVDELLRAKRNRELVKDGVGNEFYDNQSKMCWGWEWGTVAPKELVLGTLPQGGLSITKTDSYGDKDGDSFETNRNKLNWNFGQ